MLPIATAVICSVVCLLSVGHMYEPSKTAEPIEKQLGGADLYPPKESCIGRGQDPSMGTGNFWGCPAH